MKNLAKWLLAAPLIAASLGSYALVTPLQPKTGTITTQNLVSGGTATAGSCVESDVSTAGAIRVQTIGTYTASGGLSLRETVDGVHWITDAGTTTFTRQTTGVTSATITSGEQDIYLVAVTGARRIGICAGGAVTGTATITIQPTELSLGGGGSGGSGTDPRVSQASTTSGQTGTLIQAAATTSAPTYSNGTTNPLSTDTSGNLRVNVVTGGTSGAVAQASTTSGQTGNLTQGAVTTSAPTYTTGQTNPVSLTTSGEVRMISTTANTKLDTLHTDLTATNAQLPPATGTQSIANSMSVTPATSSTFAVSAASLPLPSGAATSANQTPGSATAYSDATRMPVELRDSLALTISSISAAAGTATATFTNGSANIGWTSHGLVANQTVYFTTTGTLPTNFSAGTVTTNNYYVRTVVDANTFTVSATPGGTAITAGSAGSGTQTGVAPTVMFYQDLTGYESYSYQVTSAGTSCTITYETSDDAQNWIVHPGLGSSLNNNVGSTTSTTTAVGTKFGKWGKYSRARVSTYTSGTVSAVGTAHRAPFTSQLAIGAGTGFSVAGGSAQGVAVSGNPFMMGLEAYTAQPTAVTTGQTTRATGTTDGKLVVSPYSVPELQWQKTINLTDTTSTSMNAAPGSGLRAYVTWCLISTISTTTAIQVKLLDGSTVMLPYNTPGASDSIQLGFPTPLRQPTTNTAFNIQLSGSPTGAVDVTCGGFNAP